MKYDYNNIFCLYVMKRRYISVHHCSHHRLYLFSFFFAMFSSICQYLPACEFRSCKSERREKIIFCRVRMLPQCMKNKSFIFYSQVFDCVANNNVFFPGRKSYQRLFHFNKNKKKYFKKIARYLKINRR